MGYGNIGWGVGTLDEMWEHNAGCENMKWDVKT